MYTDMVAAARTMSGFMQRRKRKNQMAVCTVEQKDKVKAGMALHGLPSSCKAYEQAVDKLVEGLHDYSTTKDTLTRLYIHTGKNVIFLLEKMLPCKLLKKIVFRQSWI